MLLFFIPLFLSGQVLYYQDIFKGGITGSGYSPIYNSGGTGTINLSYASNTERRVFILAGRHGNAPDLTVTLNGTPLTFTLANQVSPTFQSPSYGGNSGVHAIDITSLNLVDSGANTLVVPVQSGPSNRYNDFYIYVAYNYAFAATITASIFLNTHNFSTFTETYVLPSSMLAIPVAPVSYAEFGGYVCDNTTDGQNIRINATLLGDFGGVDVNSGSCGCCKASFKHENGVLTAYNNNNPNQSMGVSNQVDVTSNIRALIAVPGTSFTASHFPTGQGNTTNAHWASFVTYSTTDSVIVASCDTATRSVTNITTTTATLNWTAVAGIVFYTVHWRAVGDIVWNDYITTLTSLNLTFLTASTQYEWSLSFNCGSASSHSQTSNFTTLDEVIIRGCCTCAGGG